MTPTPPRTSRNVAASALAQVAGKASSLVWTLVAARQLTQTEFGTFNLVLAVALLASSLAEWGFDPKMVQRSSRRPDLLPRHYAESLVWQSALAVPLFVVAGFGVAFARSAAEARLTIALVLLSVFLDLWSDTGRAASAAALDQRGTSVAVVVQRIATMVLAVPLLMLGAGIVGLAAAFLASSALGVVAHAVALRRLGVRFRVAAVSRSGLREFVSGTWALGISALVLMALFRLDTVLLAWLADDAAVGAYAVAYRLFETVLFLSFAVSGAVYPLMSARADDPAAVRRGLETGIIVLSLAYLPFAAVCLASAPEVLDLLFGGRYGEESAGALRWLSAAPLVYAAAYLASAALTAINRTGALLFGAVVALIVNVVANLLLIPSLAGTGAALATTLSYAVEAAVLLVATARTTGRPRLVMALLVPLAAAAVLGGFLAMSPLHVLIEVPVGLLLYVVVWAALAAKFDRKQLDLALSALPTRAGSSS